MFYFNKSKKILIESLKPQNGWIFLFFTQLSLVTQDIVSANIPGSKNVDSKPA